MKRRILLGALIGASALAAIPTAANAATTCTFDSAKRKLEVRYGAGDTRVTVRNGAGLEFRAGTTGAFQNCFSATGVMSSAANTDKVTIAAFNSTTAANDQITTIDESRGDFSSSNPKLAFFVLTGSGRDRLIVNETSSLDQVGVQNQTGTLAVGPAVDLDMDGDLDIRMTTGFDDIVQVNGNGFSDLLDATKLTVAQAVLVGGDGNDSLKGGAMQDSFFGGNGDDSIFAQDGLPETVDGGADNDKARMDFGKDQPTSIETSIF
jgi:Ca2+-binding RTX toxin-like protein